MSSDICTTTTPGAIADWPRIFFSNWQFNCGESVWRWRGGLLWWLDFWSPQRFLWVCCVGIGKGVPRGEARLVERWRFLTDHLFSILCKNLIKTIFTPTRTTPFPREAGNPRPSLSHPATGVSSQNPYTCSIIGFSFEWGHSGALVPFSQGPRYTASFFLISYLHICWIFGQGTALLAGTYNLPSHFLCLYVARLRGYSAVSADEVAALLTGSQWGRWTFWSHLEYQLFLWGFDV